MHKYRIFQVDSFSNVKFKGNPAGVVLNADGLSDSEMQYIARELNNSETAFILTPNSNDHDLWIRFFTPTVEVPSCGHATIAAHYVNAVENNFDSCTVMQKIGIGILPVEIKKIGIDYKIYMTQGKIEFADIENSVHINTLLDAIGVKEADIDPNCPIQIVSTGHSKVVIGIKSKKLLNSINPDLAALKELSSKMGTIQNGSRYLILLTLVESEVEILLLLRMKVMFSSIRSGQGNLATEYSSALAC